MAAAKANVKVGNNVLEVVRCESEVQKKNTSKKTINWNSVVAGQYILKVMNRFIERVKFELKKTM